jgi:hypothetical protein
LKATGEKSRIRIGICNPVHGSEDLDPDPYQRQNVTDPEYYVTVWYKKEGYFDKFINS